jgi:hypothetical protein
VPQPDFNNVKVYGNVDKINVETEKLNNFAKNTKIGCISALKTDEFVLFCIRFALSLQ